MHRKPCSPSGVTGKGEMKMKTKVLSVVALDTSLLSISAAALAGIMLLALAGFAQASDLHDSAHDTRHAIAFPCH